MCKEEVKVQTAKSLLKGATKRVYFVHVLRAIVLKI